MRDRFKQERNRNKAIQRFSEEFAAIPAARLEELEERQKSLDVDLATAVNGLRAIRQELIQLNEEHDVINERVTEEKRALLEDAKRMFDQLTTRIDQLPAPWRDLVAPERRIQGLKGRLGQLVKRSESDEADLHYRLKEEAGEFVKLVENTAEQLKQPTELQAEDAAALQLVARWIASGEPFRTITIMVKERT